MASKHQLNGVHESGSEEDSNAESVVQTGSEKDTNESTDEATDSQMEEDEEKTKKESVWKYYSDIAWQNAFEERNSAYQNSNSRDEEKVWEIWGKAMDKHFLDAYRQDILHYTQLEEDPVHQAVMKSKKKLMEDFDMKEDEASNVAITSRKYLIMSKAPSWKEKMTNEGLDE